MDDDFSSDASDANGTGLSSFLSPLASAYATYTQGQTALNAGNAASTAAAQAQANVTAQAAQTQTLITYGFIAVGLVLLVWVFKKLL